MLTLHQRAINQELLNISSRSQGLITLPLYKHFSNNRLLLNPFTGDLLVRVYPEGALARGLDFVTSVASQAISNVIAL